MRKATWSKPGIGRTLGVWTGRLGVIGLIFLLGKKPPMHTQTVYKEDSITAPVVQTTGYATKNFSTLEMRMGNDAPVIYHPSTAVKKWDGTDYVERSRQAKDWFAYTGAQSSVNMTLKFPQPPVKLLVNGADLSTNVREVNGQYSARWTLEEITGGAPSERCEVVIYYRSEKSDEIGTPEDVKNHAEDAERYVLTLKSP